MASRPRPVRVRTARVRVRARRALLGVLLAASVTVPVVGAARPAAVPAPAPARLAPLHRDATAEAQSVRYAANRKNIRAAERTAARHGDRTRAAALHAMARPGRHFISFDGRNGGRSAEVFGKLAGARRIAVLVPGSDTSLDHYWRLRDGAAALHRELGAGSAVIAWLGYRTPDTVSPEALTPGRADDAAPELLAFVRELAGATGAAGAAGRGARIALACHSYGSVVCARSAAGTAADDIVLFGSPGTGSDTAAALRTRATVWAGRGSGDWISRVPHRRLQLPFATIGFGTDPVAPEFGARIFDAGRGGHSDYLVPGSVPLRSIAGIVAGHYRDAADRTDA
jgi:hypothetical protein